MDRYNAISMILHILIVVKSSFNHIFSHIKYVLSFFRSEKMTLYKLDGFKPFNGTYYVKYNLKYNAKINILSIELYKLYQDKQTLERFSKDDMLKIFFMHEIVRRQNEGRNK